MCSLHTILRVAQPPIGNLIQLDLGTFSFVQATVRGRGSARLNKSPSVVYGGNSWGALMGISICIYYVYDWKLGQLGGDDLLRAKE